MLKGLLLTSVLVAACAKAPRFVELPDGRVESAVHVKLANESEAARHYSISIREPDAKLRVSKPRWEVAGGTSMDVSLSVDVPRTSFVNGRRKAYLYVDDSAGFHRVVTVTLIGPQS